MRFTKALTHAIVCGGLAAVAVGLAPGSASAAPDQAPAPVAGPAMPVPPPMPPAGPNPASPPAWAPPAPQPPVWSAGNRQVWDQGWQHWGVWINGVFVPTF